MSTLEEWPQPYRLPDAAPYWAALEEERLTFQRCDACSDAVWPPHRYCPSCHGEDLSWQESGGRGAIYSFSVVHRGPTPVWAGIAPYAVGFVLMDDGYSLFGQIEGDPSEIAIDRRVRVAFTRRGEQTLPVFQLEG